VFFFFFTLFGKIHPLSAFPVLTAATERSGRPSRVGNRWNDAIPTSHAPPKESRSFHHSFTRLHSPTRPVTVPASVTCVLLASSFPARIYGRLRDRIYQTCFISHLKTEEERLEWKPFSDTFFSMCRNNFKCGPLIFSFFLPRMTRWSCTKRLVV